MRKVEDFVLKLARWIGSVQSLIIHTILFTGIMSLVLFGIKSTQVLLILTTLGTMEAVYLGIIIQISINRQTAELEDVDREVHSIHGEMNKH